MLMLDLDHFKPVNDSLGHAAGDEILRQVASRLTDAVGDRGTPTRLGGDEFAIILPSVNGAEEACAIGRAVIATLGRPFIVEGREVEIGASVGVCLYPQHTDDPERLLRLADIALYQAKAAGRNQLCVYGGAAACAAGGAADYVI